MIQSASISRTRTKKQKQKQKPTTTNKKHTIKTANSILLWLICSRKWVLLKNKQKTTTNRQSKEALSSPSHTGLKTLTRMHALKQHRLSENYFPICYDFLLSGYRRTLSETNLESGSKKTGSNHWIFLYWKKKKRKKERKKGRKQAKVLI